METRSTHILSGIAAGLIGGIVFGALAAMMGMLPSMAAIVGGSEAMTGFIVNLVISAIVAALFVVLFGHLIESYAEGLTYGLIYGIAWWVLGALILMPLLIGAATLPIASIAGIAGAWQSLLMHLLFGAILGVGYVLFRTKPEEEDGRSRAEYQRYEYRQT